jgi:hypothetical protein
MERAVDDQIDDASLVMQEVLGLMLGESPEAWRGAVTALTQVQTMIRLTMPELDNALTDAESARVLWGLVVTITGQCRGAMTHPAAHACVERGKHLG